MSVARSSTGHLTSMTLPYSPRKRISQLNSNIFTMQEEKTQTTSTRTIKCLVCDLATATKSSWNIHLLHGRGRRPGIVIWKWLYCTLKLQSILLLQDDESDRRKLQIELTKKPDYLSYQSYFLKQYQCNSINNIIPTHPFIAQ